LYCFAAVRDPADDWLFFRPRQVLPASVFERPLHVFSD
jgi:hypothetical protein